MKPKLIIAAAVVAAAVGVWFFYFRRRVQGEVNGASLLERPPSPQAAIAQLQTSASSAVGQIVQGVAYRALDTVGTAVVPNLPQSSPRPLAPCPPGYTGYHPDDPAHYCAGSVAAGGRTSALLSAIGARVGMNYNAGAGYYG